MARRRKARRVRTFNERGAELGNLAAGASGSWDSGAFTGPEWYILPGDDRVLTAEVPNDTPLTPDVISIRPDYPAEGITTWYAVSAKGQREGQAGAMLDTLAATGAQVTAAGSQLLDLAATVTKNLGPILLGLAALWVFFQMERAK